MYKNILVPTDGSPLAVRAVKAAVKLAKSTGAAVTGVFVAPTPTPVVFSGILPVGYMAPEAHQAMIDKASARHLGVVEKAAAAAGVACRCFSPTGDFPADAILDIAAKQKCDLIFMASHGRRGLTALLLGSETQKVLAHARIPVLVHR